MFQNAKKGFTLVELSIVLVIVGLIVASIVAGQTFVRQAKIRSIISDINQYTTAYNTFKLQYNALPGDISTAQNYWGVGVGNGDGDQLIENYVTECLYAWEHLAEAGMVAGTYTGSVGSATDVTLNSNAPGSAFTDVGFFMVTVGTGSNCIGSASSALYGTITNVPVLLVGYTVNASDGNYGCPRWGFLTIEEAKGIDKKLDDEQPTEGNLLVANGHSTNTDGTQCLNAAITASSASYDYTETGKNCRLLYLLEK